MLCGPWTIRLGLLWLDSTTKFEMESHQTIDMGTKSQMLVFCVIVSDSTNTFVVIKKKHGLLMFVANEVLKLSLGKNISVSIQINKSHCSGFATTFWIEIYFTISYFLENLCWIFTFHGLRICLWDLLVLFLITWTISIMQCSEWI